MDCRHLKQPHVNFLRLAAFFALIGPFAVPAAPATDNFPSAVELPDNSMMPDPFKKRDGTRVATLAEWKEQRAHLRAMLEHYVYGRVPPRPTGDELAFHLVADERYAPADTGVIGRKQSYEIVIRRNSLTQSFHFTLYRPEAPRRYPALINNYVDDPYGAVEGVRRGYLFVEYNRKEVAPDDAKNRDRHAGIFRLYPDYDFHTIAAWAWAYQPVIDVLDRIGAIDLAKIAVTGHSRGGAAAMAGGIFDERIALVAPSTGGVFSVGAVRQRDPKGYRGTMDYPSFLLRTQPHWYHPRYFEFADRQNKLPWDAPTLVALIAP